MNGVAKQRLLSNFMHTKCSFQLQLKQSIHFGLKHRFYFSVIKTQNKNITTTAVAKEREEKNTTYTNVKPIFSASVVSTIDT